MKSGPSTWKITYLRVFVLAIIITAAAGWILTDFLGRVAEKEFKEKVDRDATLISFYLHDNLGDVESAAKSLGPAEAIIAALATGGSTDLERANKLLDRIKNNFEMSLCFLMDRGGLTVASSNRNEKNGLVGISFADRPYFAGAVAGRLTTYFALGKITSERGYYAAIPVIGSVGATTGVVVVKRSVAPVEDFFRKYSHVYLVSPEGIIFISSREENLFRSLWPVDEIKRTGLLASGQFGSISFEPLLAAEPRAGTYVAFENEDLYVQRLPFGSDGWSLVLMDDPGIVSSYRLFGILLTIVFGLMLLFFLNILLNKEKSLKAARTLFKEKDDWGRIFDAVPEPIAIIDPDYRIINMNRSMAERLGISREGAIGRKCHELVHDCQEPHSSCPLRKLLVSGKTEAGILFEKNLDSDFIVAAAPILAEDGTIEAFVHMMHDVSELKRLERLQKEYAQRLEFVLEGSNDATWEWDIIADRAVLNRRYFELMGYAPGEIDLNFATFLTTIHPDDASGVQSLMQGHLDGKTKEYQAHFRMVTKSGKLKDVMMRGKVVRHDEDGRPIKIAGVTTDVTEMKRLSEEVNRISNLESIGLLSGGLAHDFNNVLNIIYGNITFAKMLAEGNTAITEPLTDAEGACERAKDLGIRLQAFSQGSSPVKESITLSAIIEDAAGTIFKGSNISHSISVAVDVLPVNADIRLIRQVFENLLSNAKDAMSCGGTIKINIDNFVVDGNNMLPLGSGLYICIALQDDGKGIPEENLPKIFDPYFSTKDTYSQRGMGLGLSICHAILKRHGGHISVESTVGVGTRVTVYLPASAAETALISEGRLLPLKQETETTAGN